MSRLSPVELSEAFAALGDPTRWTVLVRLSQEPRSASALARDLPISRQAIAKHLAVLRESGLIATERRGREIVYLPLGSRLSALGDDLIRLGETWDRRLAAIKRAAESSP
ncbi:metalloregulator ArsR/SmtB family transcription factor [Brevibacterium daeguense]|uniref:Metalloregulator ArsR/SmtB family transcription factor n=1 Tax=Brevibacterium daeguense TaxID=909936 RepID=A0ABP8EJI7_9MICO|nr:metalloregulator ArsR/SmtB family transcription factor [Brevibacterium daeguense]